MAVIVASEPKSASNEKIGFLTGLQHADFAIRQFFGILFALGPVAGRVFLQLKQNFKMD
jgi:hypothetical protein